MPGKRLALGVLALAVTTPAAADVRATVAAGAGQRASEPYQAVEARLELQRPGARLDLALRGQWDDGRWRREDFTTARGWAQVVRALQWATGDERGGAAVVAGSLRPEPLAQVSDGVHPGLDDVRRTGARAQVQLPRLVLRGELDDVVAPRMALAAATWAPAGWELVGAAAVGWGRAFVAADDAAAVAIELAAARRLVRGAEQARLGGGAVVEPFCGAHALAFAELQTGGAGWQLWVRADLRAGTGSLGTRFGPLAYARLGDEPRAERAALGGAVSAQLRGAPGFAEVGLRRGPDGAVVSVHAGAALTAQLQLGGYLAVDERGALGAAEVRAFAGPRWGAWARGTFLALEASRLVRASARDAAVEMPPAPSWAATAWLGASR